MKRKIPIINSRGETYYLDDDSNVVPPGYGIRQSMMLMDGADDVQRAIASTNVRVVDAAGRPAGSRPGFCFDTSNSEAQARAAYDAHIKFLGGAWRGSDIANASPKPDDQTLPTTDDARAAYIARLPNAWKTNAADAATISDNNVDAAREAYKTRLENAWRTA